MHKIGLSKFLSEAQNNSSYDSYRYYEQCSIKCYCEYFPLYLLDNFIFFLKTSETKLLFEIESIKLFLYGAIISMSICPVCHFKETSLPPSAYRILITEFSYPISDSYSLHLTNW